ncbi:MAG: PKD domain-containing protein, partial [Dehalococcoidales bacterium]|nr:PKD domain-containing protein [Dehalococcoidales bacterium]
PPAGGYLPGTEVTLTPVPFEGYYFDMWGGDLSSNANPATIIMDSDKTVTAFFPAIPHYTLEIIPPRSGNIEMSPEQPVGGYLTGEYVTLTAVPFSGYAFDFWEGDLTGNTNPETIIIDSNKTVTAYFNIINQPPVAGDDAYTIDEDTTLEANLLDNDSDADGDPLTLMVVSVAQHGSCSIDADGSLNYTPDANFSGSDTFTYKTSDGTAESNIATVTITINPINDTPVADTNGTYSGYEGSPVTLDGTDSYDSDGTIVTYNWDFGDTGAGSELIPEHTYLEDGIYTVTLTVTDNEGATDTATTTVTVLNVAPIVEAGEDVEIPEGTKFRFMGSFTDPGLLDKHIVEWNFGDGGTAEGNLTPEYSYGDNGVYTVMLTVTVRRQYR